MIFGLEESGWFTRESQLKGQKAGPSGRGTVWEAYNPKNKGKKATSRSNVSG